MFKATAQSQNLVHDQYEIRCVRVNAQFRMERLFVVECDVGAGYGHLPLAGGRAREPPANSLLPFGTEFRRADELHLGEVRDPVARRVPPGSSRRRRVEDDRHPGFAEDLGGEREAAPRPRTSPLSCRCPAARSPRGPSS